MIPETAGRQIIPAYGGRIKCAKSTVLSSYIQKENSRQDANPGSSPQRQMVLNVKQIATEAHGITRNDTEEKCLNRLILLVFRVLPWLIGLVIKNRTGMRRRKNALIELFPCASVANWGSYKNPNWNETALAPGSITSNTTCTGDSGGIPDSVSIPSPRYSAELKRRMATGLPDLSVKLTSNSG